MFIRRDGLMAAPYPQANDFEKLLSARMLADPQVGLDTKQREAIQRQMHEQRKAELLSQL
jgi:hypothetical protein